MIYIDIYISGDLINRIIRGGFDKLIFLMAVIPVVFVTIHQSTGVLSRLPPQMGEF